MKKLLCVTFISAAVATSPALARGGFAAAPIAHPNPAHPNPHVGSHTQHTVGSAVQGQRPLGDRLRRLGPIVIVVGGSYEQQHDAYCAQNYLKYDPASETYLGEDGQRYLCPEIPE
jgi:BA14K-like protein